MAIYAIGDLHLSKAGTKPMDIFGWKNHKELIFEDWKSRVNEEDTVIIAGDTSWATYMEEAMGDLEDISELPGKKILIRGNHDYWWSTIAKMNKLFENMSFIQNNHYVYEDYAICGTRGWLCPNKTKFDENDLKIYKREIQRLRLSLESAKKAGYKKYIVVLHYPPTNEDQERSEFQDVLEEYGVEKIIYGHLHGRDSFKSGLQGIHNEVEYKLVSCDYLEFKLHKIL